MSHSQRLFAEQMFSKNRENFINGKFGVADNVSVRLYVNFPTGGTDFGASLTYDWNLGRLDTPLPK
jgi:hypothetical protein